MNLNEISLEAFKTATEHGFWTGPEQDNIPTKIALIHEEVSEALKAFRIGDMELHYVYKSGPKTELVDLQLNSEGTTYIRPYGKDSEWHEVERGMEHETMLDLDYEAKPEGFGVELADAIIRIADLARRHDIDLDGLVRLKMDYNKTRPHMHGGRKV